jgi:hypothetical protein
MLSFTINTERNVWESKTESKIGELWMKTINLKMAWLEEAKEATVSSPGSSTMIYNRRVKMEI